jgi:uncharacterized protein
MNEEYKQLIKLGTYKMPYGKYKGCRLIDIPERYYIWFMQKGLPEGDLGAMMSAAYEIKLNGLEHLFDQFR